jgi:hypothetical protein
MLDSWRAVLDANITITVLVTQYAIRAMRGSKVAGPDSASSTRSLRRRRRVTASRRRAAANYFAEL